MNAPETINILIVDDNAANRYVLSRYLRQAGYEVQEAATGQESLALLSAKKPELVILDICLPDTDGRMICRRIKSNPETAAISIIHVSATFTSPSDRISGLEAGADAYLSEPIEPRELLAEVRALLRIRQAEQALRQSEQRYRLLFDQNPDGIFAVDTAGRFILANPACEAICGYPTTELLQKNFLELCTPDQLPKTQQSFEHAMEQLAAGRLETAIIGKDGRRIELLVSGGPILEAGQVTAIHCTAKDITERKRDEQLRRQNEAFLSSLLDSLPTHVAVLDRQGCILAVNESWRRFARENGAGENARIGVGVNYLEACRAGREANDAYAIAAIEGIQAILEHGLKEFLLEYPCHSPQQERWFLLHAIRPGDEVGGAVLTHLDISPVKHAEAALRESEEHFRTMAEGLPLMIWVHDAEGRLQFYNRTYREFFGVSQELTPGFHWQPLLHPKDAADYASEFFARSRAREPFHAEARMRRADGEWRWIESWGRPRISLTGEFLGFIGGSADVTERKRMLEALTLAHERLRQQADQLEQTVRERTAKLRETVEDLEHFSYSITHDLRAPLRALIGYSELMLETDGPRVSVQGRDYLRRIEQAAERMDRLITDALQYSRAVCVQPKIEPVALEPLVRGMIETYPHFQPPHTIVRVDGPLPVVLGNPASLTQCLSNLLDNAVKFVAPGVQPTIRIWADWKLLSSPFPIKPQVRLWVEDNGIGIAEEHHKRIFGMFQRLSSAYDGTGIGLTLVRKAIERLGGSVGVESEPGRGSRFWMLLPVVGAPLPPPVIQPPK